MLGGRARELESGRIYGEQDREEEKGEKGRKRREQVSTKEREGGGEEYRK